MATQLYVKFISLNSLSFDCFRPHIASRHGLVFAFYEILLDFDYSANFVSYNKILTNTCFDAFSDLRPFKYFF